MTSPPLLDETSQQVIEVPSIRSILGFHKGRDRSGAGKPETGFPRTEIRAHRCELFVEAPNALCFALLTIRFPLTLEFAALEPEGHK